MCQINMMNANLKMIPVHFAVKKSAFALFFTAFYNSYSKLLDVSTPNFTGG